VSKVSGKNIYLHVIMIRELAWHRRITKHKRLVPYDIHPNFCLAKTSFMLEKLNEIAADSSLERKKSMISLKFERF